jgi:hypothetical protein
MSTYSKAFNKLHELSINAKAPIEDFDARNPVELATRNIAAILGLIMTAEYNQEMLTFRSDALKYLGGLTKDEWDNIRWTMLGNVQLLTAKMDFKNRRIDWIRDLETIYAFGGTRD